MRKVIETCDLFKVEIFKRFDLVKEEEEVYDTFDHQSQSKP